MLRQMVTPSQWLVWLLWKSAFSKFCFCRLLIVIQFNTSPNWEEIKFGRSCCAKSPKNEFELPKKITILKPSFYLVIIITPFGKVPNGEEIVLEDCVETILRIEVSVPSLKISILVKYISYEILSLTQNQNHDEIVVGRLCSAKFFINADCLSSLKISIQNPSL